LKESNEKAHLTGSGQVQRKVMRMYNAIIKEKNNIAFIDKKGNNKLP
jgi:hypothetical protein